VADREEVSIVGHFAEGVEETPIVLLRFCFVLGWIGVGATGVSEAGGSLFPLCLAVERVHKWVAMGFTTNTVL
jgi:hypothetical protein